MLFMIKLVFSTILVTDSAFRAWRITTVPHAS